MSFKTRIRNKRDTASNWESNNPILLDGELIVVDTNAGDIRFKIGDGTKTYTQLPFQDEVVYNALSGKAESKDLATLEGRVTTAEGEIELLQTAVDGKQDTLTFDETPTEGSYNPVTSGGIKSYVDSAIETNKPRVYADHIILTDSVNGFDYVIKMVNGNLVSSALATAISISEPPSNTTFYDGDTIDLSDMKLVATCSDGSTREVADYTYEPTVATEGTTVVTISYGEGANTFTAELNVVCESIEHKLIDFNYVKNGDGTYTLTGWNQTLNGEPSTRMIVPNSNKVII